MNVKEIHKFSSNNVSSLISSKKYGCFCCLNINKVDTIHEWIDNFTTALCGSCGIDSIIPDNDIDIDIEMLTKMNSYWFRAY